MKITFSAESGTNGGKFFARAVIDGQVVSDVLFDSPGTKARGTRSFTFVRKAIPSGNHDVRIQWSAQGPSASVFVINRTLAVFASPASTEGGGLMAAAPFYPGANRPTREQITSQYIGSDGGRSVRGWYSENTGGRFLPGALTVLPAAGDTNQPDGWCPAPTGERGTWYWDNEKWYVMWERAIKAADPAFNFHQYDSNGDNHITGDELLVSILRPGIDPYGTLRSASVAVDGKSVPLEIDLLDIYFSANASQRIWNVGTISHEAAHDALGAVDMYSGFDTSPGTYSIMDWHGDATHFDPFHKLKSGYLTPDVVEINRWKTRTVGLRAMESYREAVVVYEPKKKDKEYFIIENRWTGTAGAPNYDQYLPTGGIAVWHIIEDMALANQFPRPGDPSVEASDWGRRGVRFLGVLASAGATRELKWADGTSAKIRITAQNGPGVTINTTIAKLP